MANIGKPTRKLIFGTKPQTFQVNPPTHPIQYYNISERRRNWRDCAGFSILKKCKAELIKGLKEGLQRSSMGKEMAEQGGGEWVRDGYSYSWLQVNWKPCFRKG